MNYIGEFTENSLQENKAWKEFKAINDKYEKLTHFSTLN